MSDEEAPTVGVPDEADTESSVKEAMVEDLLRADESDLSEIEELIERKGQGPVSFALETRLLAAVEDFTRTLADTANEHDAAKQRLTEVLREANRDVVDGTATTPSVSDDPIPSDTDGASTSG